MSHDKGRGEAGMDRISEVIDRAADIIVAQGWQRDGGWFDDGGGTWRAPSGATAPRCAEGAIEQALRIPHSMRMCNTARYAEVKRVIDVVLCWLTRTDGVMYSSLMHWNDRLGGGDIDRARGGMWVVGVLRAAAAQQREWEASPVNTEPLPVPTFASDKVTYFVTQTWTEILLDPASFQYLEVPAPKAEEPKAEERELVPV